MPSPNQKKSRSRSGFSLVELSVVVAIISVVAVFGLEGLATFINRTNGQVTQEKLKTIDEAIAQFFRIYGRIPCPTDITVASTPPSNFGLETCTLTVLSGTTIGGGLLSGGVPYRALNIPMSYTLDGFGSRINYVATKNLTMAGAGDGQYGKTYDPTTPTANDGMGGIEIRSGILVQPCPSGACQLGANPTYDVGTNPNPAGAAYVIFSSGDDRRGAYSKAGTLLRNCTDAAAGTDRRIDTQNCVRGDTAGVSANMFVTNIPTNVFYDNRYSAGLNLTNYFDDYVVWRSRSQL